jgi:hypothetical protein
VTRAAKIGSAGELLLEDLSLFGEQENFNDFINKRTDADVADYFDAMAHNDRLKRELAEASRRNRAKLRKRRTREEILAFQKQLRAERFSAIAARKKAYEEVKERRRLDVLAKTKNNRREEELLIYGRTYVGLLERLTGADQKEARKAAIEMKKLFPTWTLDRTESKALAAKKKEMSKECLFNYEQDESEANDIQKLRYRTGKIYVPHFMAILKAPDGGKGTEVPLLNPMWVRMHFHENFVAMVMAYAEKSSQYVPVPVGSARFMYDAPPPPSVNVSWLSLHYPQGDRAYCLFYSFASVLFYLGFDAQSEIVRMAGHKSEHKDSTSQITCLRETINKLSIFQKDPVVWGRRKKKKFVV